MGKSLSLKCVGIGLSANFEIAITFIAYLPSPHPHISTFVLSNLILCCFRFYVTKLVQQIIFYARVHACIIVSTILTRNIRFFTLL